MSNITVGDGVMYHGSVEDAHGLYVVVAEDPKAAGRWVIASPDTGDALYHVRPTSFEVLLSSAALDEH